MKKIFGVGLVVLFVLSVTLLMAARYTHQGTRVSIWFPDKWTFTQVGKAFYAESPDGRAMVQYIGLGVKNMTRARLTYRKFLEPQIKNYKVLRQGGNFVRHNMTFKLIHGEGMIKGSPWDMKVYLIQAPGNMGMLVQRHRRGSIDREVPFTNILESIKPF